MLDFDYNWTEPQMRSWLAVKEPDWDAPFKDHERRLVCVEGFEGEEKTRISCLIHAYWEGRLSTAEFVRRFETGLWPAGDRPRTDDATIAEYRAHMDAPYGTDAAGRITQARVEAENLYRAAVVPFPPLSDRLRAAEAEARRRYPQAFEGIAPPPMERPDSGPLSTAPRGLWQTHVPQPARDSIKVVQSSKVECLNCRSMFDAIPPADKLPCPKCKSGRLVSPADEVWRQRAILVNRRAEATSPAAFLVADADLDRLTCHPGLDSTTAKE